MINKLAKLLLNEIQSNTSKNRVLKLARLLKKVAITQLYKDSVIDNFITMFQNADYDELKRAIELCQKYATIDRKGNIINFPRVYVTSGSGLTPSQQQNIKTLFSIMPVRIISKLADKITKSAGADVPNTPVDKIEIFDTLSQERHDFIFSPTNHYAERKFLRGVTPKEEDAVLEDLSKSIIFDPIGILVETAEETFEGEGSITKYIFKSKEKKAVAGTPITVVFAETTRPVRKSNIIVHYISLITIYPEDKNVSPTITESIPAERFSTKVLRTSIEDTGTKNVYQKDEDAIFKRWLLDNQKQIEKENQLKNEQIREKDRQEREKKEQENALRQQYRHNLKLNLINKKKELGISEYEPNEEEIDAQEWLQKKPPRSFITRGITVVSPRREKVPVDIMLSNTIEYSIGKEGMAMVLEKLSKILKNFLTEEKFTLGVQIPCDKCRLSNSGAFANKTALFIMNFAKFKFAQKLTFKVDFDQYGFYFTDAIRPIHWWDNDVEITESLPTFVKKAGQV